MKRPNQWKQILEYLRNGDNIGTACKRASVSRAAFYRKLERDLKYKKLVDQAEVWGDTLLNEYNENILLELIQKKDGASVRYRLSRRHPKYMNRPSIQEVKPTEEKIPDDPDPKGALTFYEEVRRRLGLGTPAREIAENKHIIARMVHNRRMRKGLQREGYFDALRTELMLGKVLQTDTRADTGIRYPMPSTDGRDLYSLMDEILTAVTRKEPRSLVVE